MKKIKRKPSRLHRALRAAAVMLCAAVLYLFLADAKLTPMMAVHMLEEFHGIYEETHVVASCGTQEGRRYYLMAGENALLCAEVDRHGLLWQDTNGTVLDCSDGEPFQAGGCSRWPHGGQGTLELFGRIDDSSVARVEICQMRRDKWDGEMQDYVYQTRCVYPVDELIEDGGRRYFLGTYRLDDKPRSDGEYDRFVLSAYDAAGERTAEYEITNFSYWT